MEEKKLDYKQINLISRRKFIFMGGVVGGVGIVLLKLWDLQILQAAKLKELSNNNRIRINLIAAPRGSIYDITGRILVTNIPSYDVVIEVNDAKDLDLLLEKIAYVLGTSASNLRKNINSSQNLPHFPKLAKSNISYENMAIINSFPDQFRGAQVEHNLIRNYPLTDKTSHLLGFINWASPQEVETAAKDKYASSQKIGKSGIEKAYNKLLIGSDGGVLNEVNNLGQPIKIIQENAPKPGLDVYISINSDLQSFIYDSMEYNGAVIVMNASQSKILAMVSKPGFNPNFYVEGIAESEWQKMLNDEQGPLNDRCLRGVYSPGSTFKPVMAYAALDTGEITPNTVINCPGFFKHGRQVFNCWLGSGHGNLTMVEALQHSCNVYFYHLARILGIDTIVKYADKFGFGKKTNIILPFEKSGILPTPSWKLKTLKQSWLPGETINISIGQGHLSVTPLQLLVYFNALINDGLIQTPQLMHKVISQSGEDFTNTFLKDERNTVDIGLNKNHLAAILEGLKLSVNSNEGSGRAARSNLINIIGKTGTTQVVSSQTKQKIIQQKGKLDEKFYNHGWFTGYYQLPNADKISIVVMLENSINSSFASHYGKVILEKYYQINKYGLI